MSGSRQGAGEGQVGGGGGGDRDGEEGGQAGGAVLVEQVSGDRCGGGVSFRSRLHEFVLGAAGCAVDFGTFRSGVVFTFVLLVGRMVWTAVAIPRSKGRLT